MKKALILLCFVFLLTSCSLFSLDAVSYVDGLLRHNYYGEISEEYLRLVLTDRARAEEDYLRGLEHDTLRFYSFFDLAQSERVAPLLLEYYQQLSAHVSFTVQPKQQSIEDGYAVDVAVQPILLFDNLSIEDLERALAPVWERYQGYTQEELTGDLARAYDEDCAIALIDLLADKLESLVYGEEQVFTLRIQALEDGYYQLNLQDFAALDACVISYD